VESNILYLHTITLPGVLADLASETSSALSSFTKTEVLSTIPCTQQIVQIIRLNLKSHSFRRKTKRLSLGCLPYKETIRVHLRHFHEA
jgi:hypothetical protein